MQKRNNSNGKRYQFILSFSYFSWYISVRGLFLVLYNLNLVEIRSVNLLFSNYKKNTNEWFVYQDFLGAFVHNVLESVYIFLNQFPILQICPEEPAWNLLWVTSWGSWIPHLLISDLFQPLAHNKGHALSFRQDSDRNVQTGTLLVLASVACNRRAWAESQD